MAAWVPGPRLHFPDRRHEVRTWVEYSISARVPATLPLEVLEQARAEMLDWNGRGVSVMEISHRSKAFIKVAEQAEADVRELLGDPAGLCRAVPAGRRDPAVRADPDEPGGPGPDRRLPGHGPVVEEGRWPRRRWCARSMSWRTARRATTPTCRSAARWKLTPGAAYVHYCPNETIGGVEFHQVPDVGGVPLVADMSSTILSRPVDVRKFGLIYAGAQKNIGPGGPRADDVAARSAGTRAGHRARTSCAIQRRPKKAPC